MKRIWLVPFVLMSLAARANAQTASSDIPGFPGEDNPAPVQTSTAGGYTLDTAIDRLAANPAAAAVVDKAIPGLLQDDRYPEFKNMSLNMVASLSGGQITDEMLAEAADGLKAIPADLESDAKQLDRAQGMSAGQVTVRRLIGR